MKKRRTLVALVACLAATAAAVGALRPLSDWLVDTVGNDGRAVLTLGYAPWLVEDQSPPAEADAAPGPGNPR